MHLSLTGSVGNERLGAADVVKGDEDYADQVRSKSNLFPIYGGSCEQMLTLLSHSLIRCLQQKQSKFGLIACYM